MLNVIILSVPLLSVIILSVVLLNVEAPCKKVLEGLQLRKFADMFYKQKKGITNTGNHDS